MERKPTLEEAKQILGSDFIGPVELASFFYAMGCSVTFKNMPDIPFSTSQLLACKDHYILLLGVPSDDNGTDISILKMRSSFGVNPDLKEPCFYNQDWYLNEAFVVQTLPNKWYLVKKEVFENSKAKIPDNYLNHNPKMIFPSAILCTFCFFAYYFSTNGKILWEHTFIWCSDKDHNYDRIYVGKYTDISGINKSGFSIHRHLSIKNYHAAITYI